MAEEFKKGETTITLGQDLGDGLFQTNLGQFTRADLQSQGFSPVVAPPEPPTDTPQVANRGDLISRIDQTVLGGADRPATEAFINEVARASRGRGATKEELGGVDTEFGLMGANVGDVVRRFGLESELTDFGIQRKETVETPTETVKTEETVVEKPKTASEKIQELLGGFGQEVQAVKTGAREAVGLQARSQEIANAQTLVNDLRTQLQQQNVLNIRDLDAIGDKPISMTSIIRQQQALTREQKLDAMLTQNNYNNALVGLQIAQGNYDRAQDIVQQTADDFYQSFQFQLEALEQQGVIEEQEAKRLNDLAEFERDLALQGYVALTDEQAAEQRTADLFVDPVSGKSFLKPTQPTGEQFTLSAGQVRFDDQGNIVAINEGLGQSDIRTVGSEIIRINPQTGETEVIFRGKEGEDPFTIQQRFSNTLGFRKDFLKESGDFKKIRDSYARIEASSIDPSPAGDLAMIFNYMKMLDPGSVVRESEFATAANAAPALQRVGLDFNKIESVWEGKKLTDNQRADFVDRADRLFKAQADIQRDRQNENRATAESLGLDAN